MTETSFSRKMDTTGRIMIPIRLREEMNLVTGQEYKFFLHTDENGRRFVCIECPQASTKKIKEALKLLEMNGMKVVQDE